MKEISRRDFARGLGLATALSYSRIVGANERIRMGYIGMGNRGDQVHDAFLEQPDAPTAAVCDLREDYMDFAVKKSNASPRKYKDHRKLLEDKEVDAVVIATPDHWHALMFIEACNAGKDVYVEKPLATSIEEGQKMVAAARKYNRVVQAGTMQRSGVHFQQACEIVRSGKLGKVTFVRTWNYGLAKPAGIGNPPDGEPPAGLDWEMWLGPAPKRAFNKNRWGVDLDAFSHFRWFWDYAGGMMTDWGVHWLDIVQMAFNEAMPQSVVALGGKYYLTDNRDTPDTLQVTYEYPGFLATYENREASSISMFQRGGGILFHGTKGTLYLDRNFYEVVPEEKSDLQRERVKRSNDMNDAHWANFLECVKTRAKPASDVETCHRSTATCLLGNIALRSKLRIDWDDKKGTVRQRAARKYLKREYRKPWKLSV